ncbi:MAG: hypothetical protein WBZ37_29500 [Mycobacterium sp.]
MTNTEDLDALAKAAVDDLACAIAGTESPTGQVRSLAKAAVDAIAIYVAAYMEHDDASRHAPPFVGL